MANTLEILAKSGIIHIPPQLWEKIHPHVPKISQEFVEFMAAGAVRDVARKVSDRKVRTSLIELSKAMASAATGCPLLCKAIICIHISAPMHMRV